MLGVQQLDVVPSNLERHRAPSRIEGKIEKDGGLNCKPTESSYSWVTCMRAKNTKDGVWWDRETKMVG